MTTRAKTVHILSLPNELLSRIPHHLSSIYDLYRLLQTCRKFYDLFQPIDHGNGYRGYRLAPILPRPDGQYLLTPHPHLLLAGTVRQIADWALQSDLNRDELYESLARGNEGLLELAQRVTLVSILDMRQLNALKSSLLNPLDRLIDLESGPSSADAKARPVMTLLVQTPTVARDDGGGEDGEHAALDRALNRDVVASSNTTSADADTASSPTPNDEDEDTRGWLTICSDPALAILNTWIYSELFHHYRDSVMSGCTTTLDLRHRRRWLAMCCPDPNNHRNPSHAQLALPSHRPSHPSYPPFRPSSSRPWEHLDLSEFNYSHSVVHRDEALHAYYETGVLCEIPRAELRYMRSYPADYSPGIEELRRNFCVQLAKDLGVESLRWILPGAITADLPAMETRLREIRFAISRVPDSNIRKWGSGDEEEGWVGWCGLMADVHEGISTNLATDEELADEERELERRRLQRRGWFLSP